MPLQPRNTDPSLPVLYIHPNLASHATLHLPRKTGSPVEVDLEPRFARLLLVLYTAWLEDEQLPSSERGVRSRALIMEWMSKLLPARPAIDDEFAIAHYVCKLRQAIAKAVANVPVSIRPDVEIVVTVRMRGYRLCSTGIEVVFVDDSGAANGSTAA
jgi:hypothetical protein